MLWKFVPGSVLLLALAACSFPLDDSGSARIAFRVVLPDSAAGSGSGPGRFLASETEGLAVTVTSPGASKTTTYTADIVNEGGVRLARISVQTTLGPHTVSVESIDADGFVLTSGQADIVVVKGVNPLSLTLTPPNRLASGDSKTLTAGRVAYYTVSADLSGYLSLNGTGLRFWECAADGTYTGTGSLDSFLLDLADGNEKYVRVLQTGTSSFSVAVAQPSDAVVNISFQVPTAPVITFLGGSGVLDSSTVPGPPDTMFVDPQLDASLAYVSWTLDGSASYPDTTPLSVSSKGQITIDSAKVPLGSHELMITITDGAHIYSANLNFTVVKVTIPQ